MSIFLAALLASNQALPFINRPALRTLAKREAAQDKRPRLVKASSPRTSLIATADVCDARATTTSPRAELGRAYSMFGPRVSILETTCAQRMSALVARKPIRIAAR